MFVAVWGGGGGGGTLKELFPVVLVCFAITEPQEEFTECNHGRACYILALNLSKYDNRLE